MRNKPLIFNIIALFLPSAAQLQTEAYYVAEHCQGEIEHILPDRTRVDCLTDTHAIEYDYGKKWAESVGQSLHYAAHTGRRAGVVLILEDNRDHLGQERLERLIDHYGLPIDLWMLE